MTKKELPPRDELIDLINEHCPKVRTAPSMADVAIYVEKSDGSVTTTEIKENVDEATDASIRNAVERIPLLEKFSPSGGSSFFVHSSAEEFYFTPDNISAEDYQEMLSEVENLLDDAEQDEEKRELLSDKFSCDSDIQSIRDAVHDAFDKDSLDCIQTAGIVIQKIKQSEDLERTEDYNEFGWRRSPNKFEVDEKAYELGEEA